MCICVKMESHLLVGRYISSKIRNYLICFDLLNSINRFKAKFCPMVHENTYDTPMLCYVTVQNSAVILHDVVQSTYLDSMGPSGVRNFENTCTLEMSLLALP